jgi:hypothetical protein
MTKNVGTISPSELCLPFPVSCFFWFHRSAVNPEIMALGAEKTEQSANQ